METKPYVIYHTITPTDIAIDPTAQSDAFYRYKTKQLCIQTIGNGKMIRTAFTNIEEVAKDLKVPAAYIPHYLAKTIGSQATFEPSKPAMQKATISGEHAVQDLSNLLVRFIKEFVLCPKCKLPELIYSGRKDDLAMRCHSCGWKGNLSTLPVNDKFKRFVYTHPPPSTKTKSTGSAKASPKPSPTPAGGKKGTSNGKSTAKPSPTPVPDKKEDKKDQVVWLSDLSEKAQEERMENMVPERWRAFVAGTGIEEGTATETPSTESKKSPNESLKEFLLANAKPSEELLNTELRRLQTEHNLDKKALVILLFDVFLPDLATLPTNIKTHHSLLVKYVGAETFTQAVFLTCLEKRIIGEKVKAKRNEFINKKAVLLFQELYDNDILEEETILQWFTPDEEQNTQQDPLRKVIAPFCTWLEQAESESEGDDEDDEEETPKPVVKKVSAPKATTASAKKSAPEKSTTVKASQPAVVAKKAPETTLDDEIDAL